MPDHIKPKIIT